MQGNVQKAGTGKKVIPTRNNGVSRDSSSESDDEVKVIIKTIGFES